MSARFTGLREALAHAETSDLKGSDTAKRIVLVVIGMMLATRVDAALPAMPTTHSTPACSNSAKIGGTYPDYSGSV